MTRWLCEQEVEAALMEGTGIYWQAPFEALERAGIISPEDIENVVAHIKRNLRKCEYKKQ